MVLDPLFKLAVAVCVSVALYIISLLFGLQSVLIFQLCTLHENYLVLALLRDTDGFPCHLCCNMCGLCVYSTGHAFIRFHQNTLVRRLHLIMLP